MFVSKFIKLLNGFSFSFILFVPFTLNENPLTVYVKSSKYFSGKGISISYRLNSLIFWVVGLYSYNLLPMDLNLQNDDSLIFGYSPTNLMSLRKFVCLLSW